MVDRAHIGKRLRPSVLEVERGRVAFFAKAIGETNPIYSDRKAAQAAGHADILAPPTFIFAAEADSGALTEALVAMGVDLPKILHGEQHFTYHAPILAGDTITVESRVADVFDKRGGALQFIVLDSAATNQRGERAAEMRTVLVVRQ